MTQLDAAFVVLGLTLVTALVARRISAPAPVVFAVVGIGAGIAWSTMPALPTISMPPGVVLFAFLPPLLTVAAYTIPFAAFRRNLLPIAMLAIGLVLVTAAVAAWVGHAFAGLPLAAAWVLGFIVAPPDPVAATSLAAKTGLSNRLVVILEGEGLVNDAVAIVAYGLAVQFASSGEFTVPHALLTLVSEVPIGVLIGLAAGWGAARIRGHIDSVPLEIGISLVTPYLAYHVADRMGGSAVLAVVTLGFMLRASTRRVSSPVARLAARTVWSFIRYASTALVFLLLGVLIGESAVDWPGWRVLGAGALVAAAIVALRIACMVMLPRVGKLAGVGSAASMLPEQLVLGWSGMRGVVSLALALALPLSFGGDPQARHAIIFMTLVVIVATLIVQGASLAPLMRWLEVGDPARDAREERRARSLGKRAGLAAARQVLGDLDERTPTADVAVLSRVADGRFGIAGSGVAGDDPLHRAALLAAIGAQRAVVDRLRDEGHLGGALSERLDTELDLDAINLSGEGRRLTGGT